jgi:hypothetical protein
MGPGFICQSRSRSVFTKAPLASLRDTKEQGFGLGPADTREAKRASRRTLSLIRRPTDRSTVRVRAAQALHEVHAWLTL